MTAQVHDIEHQNSILARLLEVSLNLNSNLALAPLLDFIMDATCEILSAEGSSILLYDEKKDELHFVASNSPNTDLNVLASIPVPMDRSVAGQIVRENKPIMIQDAMSDSRIYKSVGTTIGFATQSLIGVPMRIKGKVIGVLEGINKTTGPWTAEDATHLSILASQAAVAIQNAQQAEALQKAYDELSQLDKLKNDFIAIASHELRTPLGVILGYASFLKEESEGDVSEHAALVLNSALHLRNLIEDMVNLRYLQRGETELICENIPVATLIEAALHDVEETMAARGHHLKLDIPDDTFIVNVDRIKLGMTISNVLSNAIKFTDSGGTISVNVECRPREVWINISDNGVGIPADQLEKIFQQFYQVADHMTRKHNGMGIGLAIGQAIVEAHGGRIWAESEGLNKGSTFHIAIPLVE